MKEEYVFSVDKKIVDRKCLESSELMAYIDGLSKKYKASVLTYKLVSVAPYSKTYHAIHEEERMLV